MISVINLSSSKTSVRPALLLRRIRLMICFFIVGLVLSGATAIPLETEVAWLAKVTNAAQLDRQASPPSWAIWLTQIQTALEETSLRHPTLFYGTDWLAFGHFVIAIAFIGALRDPVSNKWLFDFGLIACALVIPYALICEAVRGIPIWWRFIDCSFGIFGAMPLCLCKRWTSEVEGLLSRDDAD